MDLYELVHKIKNGEDSFTQFKETIKDSKKLAEEFVAFSNADGGHLILCVTNLFLILPMIMLNFPFIHSQKF